MEPINESLAAFIADQTVLTIATSLNDEPHCTPVYYAFDPNNNWLIFKSSSDTKHVEEMAVNPFVAGSILPDHSTVGTTIGVQFKGKVHVCNETHAAAKDIFYKKYPFAIAITGNIWVIQVTFFKFTNNKLGFGKKIVWTRTK